MMQYDPGVESFEGHEKELLHSHRQNGMSLVPARTETVLAMLPEEAVTSVPTAETAPTCEDFTTTSQFAQTCSYFQEQKRVVDYVLAFTRPTDSDADQIARVKRTLFQQNLEQEGLQIEIESGQRIQFVKIHAPEPVLSQYCERMKIKMPVKNQCELLLEYTRNSQDLFDDHDPNFFTPSVRIAVVNFILNRTSFNETVKEIKKIGIRQLVEDQVYLDAYPLHDGCTDAKSTGQRNLLLQEWASIRKCMKQQPLDRIKEYLGVDIAVYFGWLDIYTLMLAVMAFFGVASFILPLVSYRDNRFSVDICSDNSTIMCPQCDKHCDYWYLNSTCNLSKITHLFEHKDAILSSLFMTVCVNVYFEIVRIGMSKLQRCWGMTDYNSMLKPPRPQYLTQLGDIKETTFNNVYGAQEPSLLPWDKKLRRIIYSYAVIFVCILVTIIAAFSIILYRMAQMASKNIYGNQDLSIGKLICYPMTTAIINLLVSTFLGHAYRYVAVYMTNMEYRRTQIEYNESLNLKIYLFEFVNYYTPIFYIAFFKGKFIGYPGKYNRILGLRQEECGPGGCIMELFIEIGTIMIGKQAIGLCMEIGIPFVKQKLKKYRSGLGIEVKGSDSDSKLISYNQWHKDFNLISWTDQSLSNEYLKMIVQYGFITMFIVVFPLGPLFALLNNLLEKRLDAKKFLLFYKRPVPHSMHHHRIWFNIMYTLKSVAVFTNAFIIAFSSNMVPLLMHSSDGFVNFSLSFFNVSDFNEHFAPINSRFINVTTCSYWDYRNPPDHKLPYDRSEFQAEIYFPQLLLFIIFIVAGYFPTIVFWLLRLCEDSLPE